MQSRHHSVAPNGSTFQHPDAALRSFEKQVRRWLNILSPTSITGVREEIADCFDVGEQAEEAAQHIFRKNEDAQ